MRKILTLTLSALLATFAVINNTASSAAPVNSSDATVSTDRTDYLPGDVVVISGSGWAAGETVRLTLTEDPARHADTRLSATADEYGNIVNKEFSPTQEHVGTTFALTAVGQTSGKTATSVFTDGGSISYSGPVSLTILPGASGSFNQTVTTPSGNGNFSVSLLANGSAATWLSSSPATLSYNNSGGSKSRLITVNVPSGTAPGTYTSQVKADPSVTGVGQGPGTMLSVIVPSTDDAPPTTTATGSGGYASGSWTNQDVTVTLSATDAGSPASGIASTQYSINGGSYNNYTAPFTLSSEGVHAITFFSTDVAGNVEGGKSFSVKIDKTNPAANCGSADGNWHAANVEIPCSPSDSGGSGLVSPGDITLSTDVADGDETGNASTDSQQVCDTAGNCVDAGPVSGNMIDRKAPAVNCGSASGSWLGVDAVINCTSSDGGSGPATGSFTLSTNVASGTEDSNASTGSQQVCDAANNCTTAGPVAGNKVDKKAPSISCGSADGNWHAANVSIGCTASDGASGLALAGDASFSLSTGVSSGTETSNASTNSHGVCDGVGNCDTAGPIGGNMIDKKGPSITITAPVASAVFLLNQVAPSAYSVSDGGSGVASSTPASGGNVNTSPVGAKTFTVNATDNVGNPASSSANYSVIYNWTGFFQPVDNLPLTNKAQAGSAIPVKFSLAGNQGLGIMAAGFPVSGAYPCSTSDPAVDIEQTVNAGGSSLSYDPVANQYVYVWKTDKAWASTCRQLVVKLNDGTEHRANFQFRK